ncbi:tyrosine protein phosphatase [Halobacillus andaensis]|uniref:Tyrosine-protein phosphatase n=1 Tax=Halobacillus andaensis TaxID=1176239 RepID=A0A917B5P0_HALAA|nr:CpsB/CapC family capsule biosynthesis tyrosine phosphatase [Halobacillus andaensis]MBP2004312.1 protein-tyrosine phosphatase [Halobacillus andaensis]GGF22598.1 tyrosine protein phosphatase [Halobacillus andaensis]
MIDIHSHILPGVDDGAQTIEESIEMARVAVEEGIDTIVATPHHQNGDFKNYKNDILIQVSELNRVLEEEEIPLTVLPGQETRIHGGMVEDLQKEEILPINEYSKYVFVEFPHDQVPSYASNLLFNLQVEGYQPIIVHPERNLQLQDNPNLLYSLVKNGAFSQVTAGSITGKFGRTAKKIAYQLIDANLTHVIASDAQNAKGRAFKLKEAYNEIRKHYGQSMMDYFSDNAQYVIDNEPLASDPPLHVKKKKVLGIF